MVFTTIAIADEHFPLSGQINHGPVNVRSGANTNFEIVSKLSQGEKIVVLGKSYEWYKIQLPLRSNAFIRADYIKEMGDHGGEIVGSKVNIRSKPDSNASVLGQLSKGDVVKLTQKANDWWQIQPPSGTVAWVHSSFVDLSNVPVPDDALRKPLKAEDMIAPLPKIVKPVTPAFHARGTLKLLAENVLSHVHYKIVAEGQTICYVEDADNLVKFNNVMVSVEGIKDETAGLLSAPVIVIHKIAIVL